MSKVTRKSGSSKRAAAPVPGTIAHAIANLPDFSAIVAQAKLDGLSVLPAVKDRSAKHPAIAWKDFQRRRPNEAEIADWIVNYPSRNGIYLTGPVLGRFVLDCDNAKAIAWAKRKGIPRTQQVITSRGRHFHFQYPEEIRVYNTAGKIHEGIDIRGAGGNVVAVGSVHESGFRYKWARGCSPQEVRLAKAPKWLRDWLKEYAERRNTSRGRMAIVVRPRAFDGNLSPWAAAVIERELSALRAAVNGTRNSTLARVAFKFGQLATGGLADASELMVAVCEIASHWPNEKKSLSTIERSFAAGREHPRSAPESLESQLLSLWRTQQ